MYCFSNPKLIPVFKRVFGNEDKKSLLLSFLNAVLNKKDEKTIVDITWLDPIHSLRMAGYRSEIDVLCVDRRGEKYVTELQMIAHKFFNERMVYYNSSMDDGQASRIEADERKASGGKDNPLNPMIFLGIVGFESFQQKLSEEKKRYLFNRRLMDMRTNRCKLAPFELHFIDLSLFCKKEEEVTAVSDQWLYFLKHAQDCRVVPEIIREEAVREAFHLADIRFWNQIERDSIDYHIESLSLRLDRCAARLEQGFEKGRMEVKEAVGWNMLQSGMSVEEVVHFTGLPKSSVIEIQKKGSFFD